MSLTAAKLYVVSMVDVISEMQDRLCDMEVTLSETLVELNVELKKEIVNEVAVPETKHTCACKVTPTKGPKVVVCDAPDKPKFRPPSMLPKLPPLELAVKKKAEVTYTVRERILIKIGSLITDSWELKELQHLEEYAVVRNKIEVLQELLVELDKEGTK